MNATGHDEVPELLESCRRGETGAFDRLVPALYKEMRRLAGSLMKGERPEHTLQPTALVHEALLRLMGSAPDWEDRQQFFRAAARAMRQILIDYARARNSAKRGGKDPRVTLDPELLGDACRPAEMLDLADAVEALGRKAPRKQAIVELHYYAGLSYVEIAAVLGIAEATVDRDMRFARAWLKSEMSRSGPAGV